MIELNTTIAVTVTILLGLFFIYLAARLISAAWYRSKLEAEERAQHRKEQQ